MGRNRKRKYKCAEKIQVEDDTKIPIPNLPEKYLSLNVKSGTKMKNILEYAIKEFNNYDAILWTGVNKGIKKVISCADIFKRSFPELHEVIKLRYIKSQNSKNCQNNTESMEIRQVPEIHIFLSKEPISPQSDFVKSMKCVRNTFKAATEDTGKSVREENNTKGITTEFEEMNLQVGKKRPLEETMMDKRYRKRNKKKKNDKIHV